VLLAIALIISFNIFKTKNQSATIDKKTIRIAICSPASHPSIDDIEQGCIQTLNKSEQIEYTCTIFNANGNAGLLRAQSYEAIQGNFDAIFTIGINATQTAISLTQKKKCDIPIVFGGVDETILNHTVEHVTGVFDKPNYHEQLALLQKIKPDTKKLLLVTSPAYGPHLEHDCNMIQQILKQQNIACEQIYVFDCNELQAKVASSIQQADVLMILKDHITVTGVDALIKLCNIHNVTLVASELNSCQKGAAIGYGFAESDTGVFVAKCIQQIFEHNKRPNEIPMKAIDTFKIAINTKTARQQNLNLKKTKKELIDTNIIYY
jgi:ABC-type uncharacterized transport system substrate-binding protein